MALDVYSLLSVIINELGILKKQKVSLWRRLGESLPWQSLREWWHSFVNVTSGRTKQNDIAKFPLISTKMGWFIPVKKDGQGHILYFLFCFFFSLVSKMVWIIVVFYKLTHALHLWFCTNPVKCQKALIFHMGDAVLRIYWSKQFFFSFCFVSSLKIQFLPILQMHS